MRVLLALPLVLTAACGDNLAGPADPDNSGADQTGAVETDTTARYLPEICDVQSFASVKLDAKDSVVRAVSLPTGAAVFTVPKSGGLLRGVLVDGRGNITGNAEGTKVRSDLSFTSLSASRIDDRLVVSLVSGDQTHITAVRDDLADFRELAVASGALASDTTMMHVRNARVSITGSSAGMVATTFDNAWQSMGSQMMSTSVPTSVTSAPYGTDAMIAWSTANECHLVRTSAGIESMQPYPCQNGRLAVDYAQRGGWMVYERDTTIMIARILANGHNMIANEAVLAPYGRAPRVAFDGQNFWASYLDAHGDVIVGTLDETGDLHSLAISGTQPSADGYDLAVGGGSAAVFAIDANGLGATRVCRILQP